MNASSRFSRSLACSLLPLLAAVTSARAFAQEPAPAPAPPAAESAPVAAEEAWVPLFNGKNLDGWQPKLTGHEFGKDPRSTFRVEDGLLKVRYDEYETFGGEFGHLFFETPFERYKLRIEYRFVGEQCKDGPGWALRNSGVMLHCQDPRTMSVEQEFPVSIEAQMLGGDGKDERPTGNLCTPGTHVVMGDVLEKRHCTNSTSKTYHGDQWVVLELEVQGHEVIRHRMEGEVVLEYMAPQLDPGDGDAKKLLAAGAKPELAGGWISIQAESHPLDVSRIEILDLAPTVPPVPAVRGAEGPKK